ncbi:MAG: hypothetical protein O7F71_20560 [Gammaproteobacteria bacterium]|nr:hypothetical protein [Gammaproteobacteria bacterium]
MQYVRKVCQLVLVTIGTLSASSVFAEGTDANDVVTNAVTLDFLVNTIPQSTTTSVDFTVDRKLILEVVTSNADWVTAIPGQAAATDGSVNALAFAVTNRSNDSTDVEFALLDRSVLAVTGFAALSGGVFAPDPSTGSVWHDADDNDAVNGGEVAVALDPSGITVFSIGPLAEDATANIKVVVAVDPAALDDEHHTFTLVAAVATAGTALVGDDSGNAAPGGASVNIANDINAMETVFADGLSANAEDVQYDFVNDAQLLSLDADFDGQSVDTSGFITAVALSIAKYVEVVYDPITGNRYDPAGAPIGGADPKAIPGAVLMYVIGVVNTNASLSATAVLIDDDVPVPDVAVGDQANPATAIEIPASVSFAVGSATPTFTLDQGSIEGDLDVIWDQDCDGSPTFSTAFTGAPEVDNIALGTCAAGEDGYVVYFVTIDNT